MGPGEKGIGSLRSSHCSDLEPTEKRNDLGKLIMQMGTVNPMWQSARWNDREHMGLSMWSGSGPLLEPTVGAERRVMSTIT